MVAVWDDFSIENRLIWVCMPHKLTALWQIGGIHRFALFSQRIYFEPVIMVKMQRYKLCVPKFCFCYLSWR